MSLVLTIWTYTSFMAPEGMGPWLKTEFEKQCHCETKWESVGDTGQLMGRVLLALERGTIPADIVLGLDQFQWDTRSELLKKYIQNDAKLQKIKAKTLVKEAARTGDGFWPYDWGALAWMTQSGEPRPKWGVREFLNSKWKKKILLEDPRTSTPGWVWVAWTEHLLGPEFESFWKSFRHQWLTLTSSWDDAYGMFLKNEAPIVWSYVTSEAYHRSAGQAQYVFAESNDGHPYQVEGAVSLRKHPQAQALMKFLWSDAVQREIPTRNWMMPVKKGTALPESFQKLPVIKTVPMRADPKLVERWGAAIRQ